LASDDAAVHEAVRAWDAGVGYLVGAPDPAQPPAQPKVHRDVHVLYADDVTGGRAIVVEGNAENGTAQLGLFYSATSAPPDLRFTHQQVVAAPPPATTHHIAFFVLTRTGRALLVVIGEPGTTSVSYGTGAAALVPMPVSDGVAAAPVPPGVSRIVVANAGGTLYDGPVTDAVVAPDAVL
jgi:hypothetical protein